MTHPIIGWILVVLAILIATITGISEIRSAYWWIRIWDFPRMQIVVLATLILAAGWFLAPEKKWLFALLLLPSIAWQVGRILPYTPLVKTEVDFVTAGLDPDTCFSALSFNVLEPNRDYARTLALLDEQDPDIVLLLETDHAWAAALESRLARYPHRLNRPIDNTYGLMFATRLEMTEGEIRHIAEKETPSVFAKLRTASGRSFQYIGLHPRPPLPGQDTVERDAEIAVAARLAREESLPTLAMGDFNDVAWSHTSHLFKRIGEYLDPRIGRGPYPTFPARFPFLRWPLDHLFMSPEFTVRSMRVLENVGSDHLPLIAHLCIAPEVAREVNEAPETADAEDENEADRILQEYREEKAENKSGE